MSSKTGEFLAKPESWRVGHIGTKETECIQIMFVLEDGRRMPWTGFLTEKAILRTLDTLRLLGWDGKQSLGSLQLNKSKDVSLSVQERYNQSSGRSFIEIAWINPVRTLGKAPELKPDVLARVDEMARNAEALRREKAKADGVDVEFVDLLDDDDIPF